MYNNREFLVNYSKANSLGCGEIYRKINKLVKRYVSQLCKEPLLREAMHIKRRNKFMKQLTGAIVRLCRIRKPEDGKRSDDVERGVNRLIEAQFDPIIEHEDYFYILENVSAVIKAERKAVLRKQKFKNKLDTVFEE